MAFFNALSNLFRKPKDEYSYGFENSSQQSKSDSIGPSPVVQDLITKGLSLKQLDPVKSHVTLPKGMGPGTDNSLERFYGFWKDPEDERWESIGRFWKGDINLPYEPPFPQRIVPTRGPGARPLNKPRR